MKNSIFFKGSFLILFFQMLSFGCTNVVENNLSIQKPLEINFVPAKTNSELVVLRSQPNNMIKFRSQLDKLLLNKSTILSQIDPVLLNDFVNGLVFRDSVGVVGIKYNTLKVNVDSDTYRKIMAMFGIDTVNGFWDGASIGANTRIGEDMPGWRCGFAGCIKDPCCICLANCY